MKIKDFQQKIADAINTVEELVQGGCKAFAEDSLDVLHAVETQLQQASGVAIVAFSGVLHSRVAFLTPLRSTPLRSGSAKKRGRP